jgi:multisubunit Na+/H+ antiporter MnhE subunit
MNAAWINLGVALLWLGLSTEPGVDVFLTGWLAGFTLLAVFNNVLPSRAYVRRVLAFAAFGLLFLREFLASNIAVARWVLWKRMDNLRPNFITLDVSGLLAWERLLLSHCITLTPGTTTVDVEDDGATLVLHVLEGDDAAAVRQSIAQGLQRQLLAWSRETQEKNEVAI